MKLLIFVNIIILCTCIIEGLHVKNYDELQEYFSKRMIKLHGKKYSYRHINHADLETGWLAYRSLTTVYEYMFLSEDKKKQMFRHNLEKIIKHNIKYLNGKASYLMGLNKYAGWSDENFTPFRCNDGFNERTDNVCQVQVYYFQQWLKAQKKKEIKHELDLRKRGIISNLAEPPEILKCCSSYALAVGGAVEGHFALKNWTLYLLSSQQILENSCRYVGNKGCNGGSVVQAFQYVKNYGITLRTYYPTKSGDYDDDSIVYRRPTVTKIEGIVEIVGEDDIMRALNYGPVVGFINVEKMRFYKSGLFYEDGCSSRPNHAVLVVGYGSEDNTYLGPVRYWLIRVYWGKSWGQNSFAKIFRGVKMCGFGEIAYFPVI